MPKFLLFIWQFPQEILGSIVAALCNADHVIHVETGIDYLHGKENTYLFGVSLGSFIIFDNCRPSVKGIKHEHGHQIQSKILGPLYLIVIGLPSAIGYLLHRFIKFDYYKQPWEAWADKLGGVER